MRDRSALLVSAGKTHKIKSGCLLNVTEIRTSEIEARAIHKQEFLTFLYSKFKFCENQEAASRKFAAYPICVRALKHEIIFEID